MPTENFMRRLEENLVEIEAIAAKVKSPEFSTLTIGPVKLAARFIEAQARFDRALFDAFSAARE